MTETSKTGLPPVRWNKKKNGKLRKRTWTSINTLDHCMVLPLFLQLHCWTKNIFSSGGLFHSNFLFAGGVKQSPNRFIAIYVGAFPVETDFYFPDRESIVFV